MSGGPHEAAAHDPETHLVAEASVASALDDALLAPARVEVVGEGAPEAALSLGSEVEVDRAAAACGCSSRVSGRCVVQVKGRARAGDGPRSASHPRAKLARSSVERRATSGRASPCCPVGLARMTGAGAWYAGQRVRRGRGRRGADPVARCCGRARRSGRGRPSTARPSLSGSSRRWFWGESGQDQESRLRGSHRADLSLALSSPPARALG